MYQFLDQPIARLSPGSRFVLRAMRIWVLAVHMRVCPPRSLSSEMANLGALEITGDLHRLMLALHCHGLRSMPFATPDAARVSEAEALMLALWSEVVADCPQAARTTLGLLVGEPAIEPMMAAMTRVAAHLSTLGLAPIGRIAAAAG
jgi:hypothetical protein